MSWRTNVCLPPNTIAHIYAHRPPPQQNIQPHSFRILPPHVHSKHTLRNIVFYYRTWAHLQYIVYIFISLCFLFFSSCHAWNIFRPHHIRHHLAMDRKVCNQFSRGVYSMLGAVSPDSFDTLHSYSNTFQMPFVTPWFPEKVSYYIYIYTLCVCVWNL